MRLGCAIAIACAAGLGCASVRDLPAVRGVTRFARHDAATQRDAPKPWLPGNKAELLEDGPASYRAIFRAIAGAHDSVNLETYILQGDEVGDKLSALLVEKQSQGVQVNLLYDAVGSLATPAAFFERLRDSGVAVCEFNPLLPSRGRVADPNRRDHRKQTIVDGRIAVSGGINWSSVYSSGSAAARRGSAEPSLKTGWRDTNVLVEGPAVARYQTLFLESWHEQGCEPVAARDYFPALAPEGDKVVGVVASGSDEDRRRMYATLLSVIRESHRSVYITMAYFTPDPEILRALEDAARRGVDVQLILPGFSDSWVVLEAGRSYYGELLNAGVHISELHAALLHAKTAVVDDVWTTVGSSNLDWRSLLFNDELNTVVLGAEFGRAATAMFERDLRDAQRVDPAAWRDRGVGPRVEESVARLFAHML
ncbi:MAG TPA: phospholipase D-like domain-containing protein [Myxococcota bacterium]|nr:phospholipase D-like domain-containing protein [Myxococcota bacterium]